MDRVVLNKGRFVKSRESDVQRDYRFFSKLGEDYYSSIYKACNRRFKTPRCIKHYRTKLLARSDIEYIENEIHYLKELDHPNIMRIIEIYEFKRHLFVVTEFLDGKPLFERLLTVGKFPEHQAARIIWQVLHTVAYMHSLGIAHRDLKPEYIIFESEAADSLIRITDFKSALRLKPGMRFKKQMGTPYYMAPEIIKGSYDLKCDIWSCGVLLYVMLCGYAPFSGGVNSDILIRVKQGCYCFPDKEWGSISEAAKNLIVSMLSYDPENRPTAAQSLSHHWFDGAKLFNIIAEEKLSILSRMKAFKPNLYFRRALLLYFVSRFDLDNEDMVKVFYNLDKNNKGYLSHEDLVAAFSEEYNEEKANKIATRIMETCDLTHSGFISFSEFMIAGFNFIIKFDKPKLKQVYESINVHGTDGIDFRDFKNFMNLKNVRRSEIMVEILAEAGFDLKKKMSYDEFADFMAGYFYKRGVSLRAIE